MTIVPPTKGVPTPPTNKRPAEIAALADVDPADPYLPLDAHVISVKALYCEDGCGLVETSGYGYDRDAAEELAKYGWGVRPHSMGGLTALCKDCAERYDIEYAEDNPHITPPAVGGA